MVALRGGSAYIGFGVRMSRRARTGDLAGVARLARRLMQQAAATGGLAVDESATRGARANAWVLRAVAFLAFIVVVALVASWPQQAAPPGREGWSFFHPPRSLVAFHLVSFFLPVSAVAAVVLVGRTVDRRSLTWRPLASLVAAIAVACFDGVPRGSGNWILLAGAWCVGAAAAVTARKLRLDERLAPRAEAMLSQPAAGCLVLAVIAQGWGRWEEGPGFPVPFTSSCGTHEIFLEGMALNVLLMVGLLLLAHRFLRWLRRGHEAPWSDELLRDGRAVSLAAAGIAGLGATITALRLRYWLATMGRTGVLGLYPELLTGSNVPVILALGLSALVMARAAKARRAGTLGSSPAWTLACLAGLAPALALWAAESAFVDVARRAEAAEMAPWLLVNLSTALAALVTALAAAGMVVMMRRGGASQQRDASPSAARGLRLIAVAHAAVALALAALTLASVLETA